MEHLILAAVTGFTIGSASILFSRSRTLLARISNILACTGGSLLSTLIVSTIGLTAPTPAIAIVGALIALMLLVIFRKPHTENRNYYL